MSSLIDAAWRVALRCAYRGQLAYWFVFRPVEPSAHVAMWCGGRILVVHSSYKRHLSMPAGGLKRREVPIEGARRELREEVGIDVAASALREAGLFVGRAQWKEDRAYVFEIDVDEPPPIQIDNREVVGAEFMEPAAVLAQAASDVLRRYLQDRLAR